MKTNLKVNDVFSIDNSKTLYIVTHAVMDGGGTGHGPYDVYPDGWHVTARKIESDGKSLGSKKQFYQDGCFNNMITPDRIAYHGRGQTETALTRPIKIKS